MIPDLLKNSGYWLTVSDTYLIARPGYEAEFLQWEVLDRVSPRNSSKNRVIVDIMSLDVLE